MGMLGFLGASDLLHQDWKSRLHFDVEGVRCETS